MIICDNTAQCIGYSYVGDASGGTCYLKSVMVTAQASSNVESAYKSTATISMAATTSNQPSTTTPSSVGAYTVEPSTDHPGGDLSLAHGANFTDCMAICDNTTQCIGYSYVGDASGGTCYLKSVTVTAQASSNVASAYKSTATSSAATAVPTPSAGSCAAVSSGGVAYTDANGSDYTVQCGTDRLGGDSVSQSESSFIDCMSICDGMSGCVGYAYVGGSGAGTCYFKSSLVASSANANVDVAYKSGS